LDGFSRGYLGGYELIYVKTKAASFQIRMSEEKPAEVPAEAAVDAEALPVRSFT
jgi:hypothetical protein